jgi:acetolactate synthase regulatory subunit
MSSRFSGALSVAERDDPLSVADRDDLPLTACFSVHAHAEPGVMPRVLELFAKRGLVPQRWQSAAAGTALTIDVQIGGLGRDTVDYMANCMRQIVGVEAVLTAERRAAG